MKKKPTHFNLWLAGRTAQMGKKELCQGRIDPQAHARLRHIAIQLGIHKAQALELAVQFFCESYDKSEIRKRK